MTQGTITVAFDKCKRKLTPNKEANTERYNHKVSSGDAPSIIWMHLDRSLLPIPELHNGLFIHG